VREVVTVIERRMPVDALAAAAAVLVDRVVADPPDRFHPVAWYGSAMTKVERRTWRDARGPGVAHAAVGVGAPALTGWLFRRATRRWLGGAGASTFAVSAVVVGGGGLDRIASRIGGALARDDLNGARALLPWLVGRDPAGLDENEIARAVVESVAENTVDAVVAPVLWAAAFGAPGAAAYRAANTLDAMVGHRSVRYERFGWASARLDDLANFVPARVGALLVAAVRPRRATAVLRAVRRDAAAHPSPNAGVIEAAFAGALGIRLGGANRYGERVEHRARLGEPGAPMARAQDIDRARLLARDMGRALAAALVLGAVGSSAVRGRRVEKVARA